MLCLLLHLNLNRKYQVHPYIQCLKTAQGSHRIHVGMSLCSTQIARRSPWTCLSCTGLTRTSQALVVGSTSRSPARIHQRKHSSSKTPSPPKDDTRAIATPSEAPTKDASPVGKKSAEKRSSTRSSRQKSKNGTMEAGTVGDGMAMNLPSVPPTTHLHPAGTCFYVPFTLTKRRNNVHPDIHMSSFFSIYRPISVTTSVPTESSNKAFSYIFNPKPSPKHKMTDIMFTLASAVDALENASSSNHGQDPQGMTPEEIDLRQAVTQASSSNADRPTHLDIPAKTLHISLQELAKNFRPFNPPPAPVPLGSGTETALIPPQKEQYQTEARAEPAPTHKSYTTTLTIYESTYPNGQKTYKTHTTPIIEGPASSRAYGSSIRYLPPAPHNQPFLGRMRDRQVQHQDRLVDREGWMAISVKRQRKLKMKKHKYKKLMKRTKNLRRRLDRT
jgi:hypothetical protein